MSEVTPLKAGPATTRSVLNTQNPNGIRVVYRAQIDPRMKNCLAIQGILNPCSGLFCKQQEVYDNTYVHILENRVEVNMPSSFQCCLCLPWCSQVNDYVQVYFFDKRLGQEADRSSFLSPICCPIGLNPFCGGYFPPGVYFTFLCCPTCFDMCGEGVTMHGKLPILCCHQFAQIPYLVNADEFVQQFRRAKDEFDNGSAAPVQQTMS